jgi:hypothetical protein
MSDYRLEKIKSDMQNMKNDMNKAAEIKEQNRQKILAQVRPNPFRDLEEFLRNFLTRQMKIFKSLTDVEKSIVTKSLELVEFIQSTKTVGALKKHKSKKRKSKSKSKSKSKKRKSKKKTKRRY